MVHRIGGWPVAYTERQIKLIRDRLKAYQLAQHSGPQRMTWLGVCGRIFSLVKVQMDEEVLLQFVEQVSRKDRPDKPRIPSPKNLTAIVKFLGHEEIDMLSVEELREPEVPYGLALSFSDFLRGDSEGKNLPPPTAINGSYRAQIRGPGNLDREIELSLEVDEQNSLVRIFEHAKSYLPKSQLAGNQAYSRGEARQRVQSEGWGILTPEDNLFIFMKGKHYGSNYYYLTLGMDRNLRSESPIGKLLLLRHQYPVQQSQVPQSFDELKEESDGDTVLLDFDRLNAKNIDRE